MRTEIALGLLFSGCSGTGAGADSVPTGPITLADANNYHFSGSLNVPVVTTASARDVAIDWGQVTQDIQCHTVDPAADIDTVGLVRFGALTQAQVQAGLSSNDLQQADMSGYVQYQNDAAGTSTTLSAMSFFGTPVDVTSEYVQGGGTYLLLLATGTTPGVGARTLAFLDPEDASTNTAVTVASGCGVLQFTADLHSLSSAPVGADLSVDWSGVTADGQGNPIDDAKIDGLLLGYYEGQTVADIEGDFLNLESRATTLYSLPLTGGTSADLTLATAGTQVFTGFSGDGLWMLALTCSRCYNPAPPFLTLLTPPTGA